MIFDGPPIGDIETKKDCSALVRCFDSHLSEQKFES